MRHCGVIEITKRSVDLLTPSRKRYFASDDSLAGFGVRVEASGRKTFICRYRSGDVEIVTDPMLAYERLLDQWERIRKGECTEDKAFVGLGRRELAWLP